MVTKSVRILLPAKLLPKKGDRTELSFRYQVLDVQSIGKPNEAEQTFSGNIIVGISRSLQKAWNLYDINLKKALVELAKYHIQDKITDGVLEDEEELQLTTYNSPEKCPFDYRRIDSNIASEFQVNIPRKTKHYEDGVLRMSKIISLRDNINALFGEKYGGKLFSLPQERSLLGLSRNCETEEEFAFLVSALCELVKAINTSKFVYQNNLPPQGGSINKFGAFLRYNYKSNAVSDIMEILKSFNNLRRMFPIHSDQMPEVVRAYDFFGIAYPTKNFQEAWIILRSFYIKFLQLTISVLKNE